MKTRFVLMHSQYYDAARPVGIFKTERAAWAHVEFINVEFIKEKKHSKFEYYEVEEVESFE